MVLSAIVDIFGIFTEPLWHRTLKFCEADFDTENLSERLLCEICNQVHANFTCDYPFWVAANDTDRLPDYLERRYEEGVVYYDILQLRRSINALIIRPYEEWFRGLQDATSVAFSRTDGAYHPQDTQSESAILGHRHSNYQPASPPTTTVSNEIPPDALDTEDEVNLKPHCDMPVVNFMIFWYIVDSCITADFQFSPEMSANLPAEALVKFREFRDLLLRVAVDDFLGSSLKSNSKRLTTSNAVHSKSYLLENLSRIRKTFVFPSEEFSYLSSKLVAAFADELSDGFDGESSRRRSSDVAVEVAELSTMFQGRSVTIEAVGEALYVWMLHLRSTEVLRCDEDYNNSDVKHDGALNYVTTDIHHPETGHGSRRHTLVHRSHGGGGQYVTVSNDIAFPVVQHVTTANDNAIDEDALLALVQSTINEISIVEGERGDSERIFAAASSVSGNVDHTLTNCDPDELAAIVGKYSMMNGNLRVERLSFCLEEVLTRIDRIYSKALADRAKTINTLRSQNRLLKKGEEYFNDMMQRVSMSREELEEQKVKLMETHRQDVADKNRLLDELQEAKEREVSLQRQQATQKVELEKVQAHRKEWTTAQAELLEKVTRLDVQLSENMKELQKWQTLASQYQSQYRDVSQQLTESKRTIRVLEDKLASDGATEGAAISKDSKNLTKDLSAHPAVQPLRAGPYSQAGSGGDELEFPHRGSVVTVISNETCSPSQRTIEQLMMVIEDFIASFVLQPPKRVESVRHIRPLDALAIGLDTLAKHQESDLSRGSCYSDDDRHDDSPLQIFPVYGIMHREPLSYFLLPPTLCIPMPSLPLSNSMNEEALFLCSYMQREANCTIECVRMLEQLLMEKDALAAKLAKARYRRFTEGALKEHRPISQIDTYLHGYVELYAAALVGDVDLMESSVSAATSYGFDFTQPLCFGWTVLHLAAYRGHQRLVALLLRTDAIGRLKNAPTQSGFTPLHLAVSNGFLTVVTTLLSSGCDPRICDNRGNSALHYGRWGEDGDMSESSELISSNLLQHGVDPTFVNQSNHTALPIEYASLERNQSHMHSSRATTEKASHSLDVSTYAIYSTGQHDFSMEETPPPTWSIFTFLGSITRIRDHVDITHRHANIIFDLDLTEEEQAAGIWSCAILNYTARGLYLSCVSPADGNASRPCSQVLVLTIERIAFLTHTNPMQQLPEESKHDDALQICKLISLRDIQEVLVPTINEALCIFKVVDWQDIVVELRRRTEFIDELQTILRSIASEAELVSRPIVSKSLVQQKFKNKIRRSTMSTHSGYEAHMSAMVDSDNDSDTAKPLKILIVQETENLLALINERNSFEVVMGLMDEQTFILISYSPNSLLIKTGETVHFGFMSLCASSVPDDICRSIGHTGIDTRYRDTVLQGATWEVFFFVLRAHGWLLWCKHPSDQECVSALQVNDLLSTQLFQQRDRQFSGTPHSEPRWCLLLELDDGTSRRCVVVSTAMEKTGRTWMRKIDIVKKHISRNSESSTGHSPSNALAPPVFKSKISAGFYPIHPESLESQK